MNIVVDTDLFQHPRFASSIVGHGDVVAYLKSSYEKGRLSHGLLFTGSKGVGKATFAYQIARALLNGTMDQLGKEQREQTSTDHLLRAGNHPDVKFIEKKVDEKGKASKDISVEQVRGVVHFFSQTSVEDNWRIAIIDSVDNLTAKGANTLLKVLEEPPHKCLLILISHNLEGVLPTLRSRAQIIQFPALSKEDTEMVLKSQNRMGIEDTSFLASVSAGRPGLACMIADIGGASFYQAFLSVMSDISRNDLRSTHGFMDSFILKNKNCTPDDAWKSFFEFLNHWISHALVSTEKKESWGIDNEEVTAKNLFATRNPNQWVESWFSIQELLRSSHIFSLDKKQTLLCVFHELAGLHQR